MSKEPFFDLDQIGSPMARRSTPTVQEAVEKYLALRERKFAHDTWVNDRSQLNRFADALGRDRQMHTLTTDEVEAFLFTGQNPLCDQMAANSFNKVRSRVANWLDFCRLAGPPQEKRSALWQRVRHFSPDSPQLRAPWTPAGGDSMSRPDSTDLNHQEDRISAMHTTAPAPTVHEPSVWLGCLACYNAGNLTGRWVPAIDAAAATSAEIYGRPTAHQELWCLDTDGLPINREMSPQEATEWGEMLADVDYWHRATLAAWVASGDYVAEGTGDLTSLPDFEERYAGEWETFGDYAENLADDIGLLQVVPDTLAAYFDWAAWTRDLSYDYTAEPAPGGGVFVFRSL